MSDLFGNGWRLTLKQNSLGYFSALWQLQADWFEEPNIRRGGWSGVVKIPLRNGKYESSYIFIKRQENHLSRT